MVSNWVPDRIDLQALDGRVKTSRDREQSLQRLDGFVRLTSACLYFGIGGEKKCPWFNGKNEGFLIRTVLLCAWSTRFQKLPASGRISHSQTIIWRQLATRNNC
jgi:hypothetical protein